MKIIGEIRDKQIDQDKLGQLRQAVRCVLVDKNKKIAVGYYLPNINFPNGEYNLPGGGVKRGENIEDALVREIKEEVGCNILKIKELGLIKEYNVGKTTKHNQDTYCFIAEIDGKKGPLQLTKRELRDNLQVKWLSLDEIIEKIKNQEKSFAKTRNLICLGELKKIKNNL